MSTLTPACVRPPLPDGVALAELLLAEARRRWEELSADISAARAAGDMDAYQRLLKLLPRVEQALIAAEDRATRRKHEEFQTPEWQRRCDELYAVLRDHYGDRGPQYDLLVRQLVAAQVRFEQMEASGRDVPPAEWRRLLKTTQDCVWSLQRFTESTKVDQSAGRMEGIQVVLRIVEELVAPAYPELYAHIVDTLVERAKQGAAR